jgi:hypothetical protein
VIGKIKPLFNGTLPSAWFITAHAETVEQTGRIERFSADNWYVVYLFLERIVECVIGDVFPREYDRIDVELREVLREFYRTDRSWTAAWRPVIGDHEQSRRRTGDCDVGLPCHIRNRIEAAYLIDTRK